MICDTCKYVNNYHNKYPCSECLKYQTGSKYESISKAETQSKTPCNVGDLVYVIKNNRIYAKDVVYYKKICSRVEEQNEEYFLCVDRDSIFTNIIKFYPENIGKTVFH